jgi:hypothetical protein
MAFADVNYTDFETSNQAEVDKTLLVKFYYKSVQDQAATRAEGRPIFREKTYIDIKVPGQRDGAARPATADDKSRFQRHYDAFKARIELPVDGTPLAEWPLITGSTVEEMSFMNIKTVEQLADLSDNLAGKFMGAQNFKAKAKAWLERAKKELTAESLQHELADRDALLVDMQLQLDDLRAQLDAKPRKRKSRAKPKTLPVEGDPMMTGNDLVTSVDQIPLED